MSKGKSAKAKAGGSAKAGPVNYLTRSEKGERIFTDEDIEFYGKAVETGYSVGRRLDAMFKLREIVSALKQVPKESDAAAISFPQDDAVLALLRRAGDESQRFIDECQPLLNAVEKANDALSKLDVFLSTNPVLEENRLALTPRQLIGLFVARKELRDPSRRRLQPRELKAISDALHLLPEKPTSAAWAEVLIKMRKGALLSDLEFAVSKGKAKPKEY